MPAVTVFASLLLTGVLSMFGSSALASQSSQLKFSSDVPPIQQQHLKTDLDIFARTPLKVVPANLGKLMDLEGTVTTEDLLHWLSERVKYVMTGSLSFSKKSSVRLKSNHRFENHDLFPPNTWSNQAQVSGNSTLPRMENVGVTMYTVSKKYSELWMVRLPGIDNGILIDSARVGIVRIGPALFKAGRTEADFMDITDRGARIGTLFHEGRHSDGNGVTLGMVHGYCPRGHDYEGSLACDYSLNGPYAIGANIIKLFADNCVECSRLQKELLLAVAADSKSRVVEEVVTMTDQDRWEVESLQTGLEACESVPRAESRASCRTSMNAKMSAAKAAGRNRGTVKKSQFIDSRPEGVQ